MNVEIKTTLTWFPINGENFPHLNCPVLVMDERGNVGIAYRRAWDGRFVGIKSSLEMDFLEGEFKYWCPAFDRHALQTILKMNAPSTIEQI